MRHFKYVKLLIFGTNLERKVFLASREACGNEEFSRYGENSVDYGRERGAIVRRAIVSLFLLRMTPALPRSYKTLAKLRSFTYTKSQ